MLKFQPPKIDKWGILYILTLLLCIGIFFWFSYQNAVLRNYIDSKFPVYLKGIDGRNGIQGLPGINGTNGKNGVDGKDSQNTTTIIQKETTIIEQVPVQGEKGDPGDPGISNRERLYRLNPITNVLEWRYAGDLKWILVGDGSNE